jgi:hypothetical protein
MSTKYHSLKYFIFKHILVDWCKNTMTYHGYVMTFKYSGIQILWYSNTLLPSRPSIWFNSNLVAFLNRARLPCLTIPMCVCCPNFTMNTLAPALHAAFLNPPGRAVLQRDVGDGASAAALSPNLSIRDGAQLASPRSAEPATQSVQALFESYRQAAMHLGTSKSWTSTPSTTSSMGTPKAMWASHSSPRACELQ